MVKPMRKLARTQMRAYVRKVLQDQGGICPLCALPIDLSIPREGVLDHDHETGECRGVLHRSCNSCIGRIDHAIGRWGSKKHTYAAILPYLERVLLYYKQPGLGVIYSQHQTAEEKRVAELAKRRRARAGTRARKQVRSMKPKEVTTDE